MANPQAILQALWRKAAESAEPIIIPCSSPGAAQRRRFALYNAVKGVKKQPHLDRELAEAAQVCSIWFADSQTLCLGKQQADDDLLDLAESLGIDTKAVAPAAKNMQEKLEVEAAEASLANLLGKGVALSTEPAAPAPAATPAQAPTADSAPLDDRLLMPSEPLQKKNPYYTRERK